jgi:hypothetical protein
MGWDEAFLQSAVDTCTSLSGRIEDCPLFTIQDASVYDTCKFDVPEIVKGDNVLKPGNVLPGNVKIVAGPAPALPGAPAAASSPSTPVVPTLSFAPGTSVSSGGNYVPGAVFVASTPTADSSTLDAAPATPTTTSSTSTPPPPPPPPATTAPPTTSSLLPDQRIVSTVYSTMGNEVLELIMVEEDITVTTDVTTTVSVYTTVAGYRKRDMLRHKKRHGHGHVHGYA